MAAASDSPSLATLRALYQNATRAFVRRDVALTQSLIDSAFLLLPPPDSASIQDGLATHRRKWDILRITFETTLYSTPGSTPPLPESPATPSQSQPSLRADLMLSPQSLLATLHTRSLRLFTPPAYKPNSVFLPSQIIVALSLASLKLDCPDVGRGFIEEWLKRRNAMTDAEGYQKVLDVYCLNVLPCLGEWDTAFECINILPDLSEDKRKRLFKHLHSLQARAFAAASASRTPTSSTTLSRPLTPPTRTPSPTSSVSSTSTHTAVPNAPRHPTNASLTNGYVAASLISTSSPTTPTPASIARIATASPPSNPHRKASPNGYPLMGNGHVNGHTNSNGSANPLPYTLPTSSISKPSASTSPGPPQAPPTNKPTTTSLSFAGTIHQLLLPYFAFLRQTFPYAYLLALLPLVALILRIRNRRRRAGGGVDTTSVKAVQARARERLRASAMRGGSGGLLAWFVQGVRDTVVMAGKGLV